jgi:two-component system response regulator (stage 0 sporulation protein A)
MLSKEPDPKTDIRSVLREIGVPSNILGYGYLVRAIEMQMESKVPLGFTKGCYMGIGKEFDTTGSRVERGIRHAVEVTWKRGDIDTLMRYFGNTISADRGKPTNSQFITRIAEAVQEGRDA